MDAAALLPEYVRRHNEGVGARAFASLAALFADDGEIVFHGVSVPRATGPAAVARLFAERGPGDALTLGDVVPGPAGHAHAVYGWRASPGLVGGTIRLAAREGRIARVDVLVLRDGPREPSPRRAVRALVVSPEARVLLIRCTEPGTGASWWVTPGGGVEPGESDDAALRRELEEEVGIVAPPGADAWPCVWLREHVFTWNQNVHRQRELYHLVRLGAAVSAAPRLSREQLLAEGLDGDPRWWALGELARADEDVFAPRRFPELLAALLRDGPPPAPIDVGV